METLLKHYLAKNCMFVPLMSWWTVWDCKGTTCVKI